MRTLFAKVLNPGGIYVHDLYGWARPTLNWREHAVLIPSLVEQFWRYRDAALMEDSMERVECLSTACVVTKRM